MDRQKAVQEEAKETVQHFSRMVNGFNAKEFEKAFSDCIMREHRTLQQSMMRCFMHQIKVWSETDFYDLRNEATVMLCKKIMEAVKDDEFLPFI